MHLYTYATEVGEKSLLAAPMLTAEEAGWTVDRFVVISDAGRMENVLF